MKNTNPNHTDQTSAPTPETPLAHSPTDVDVEPINRDNANDHPVIPPNRRLSWLGWAAAIFIFIINRKLGLLFIILLIVFRQFPTLNLQSISGKAGKLYRKIRS